MVGMALAIDKHSYFAIFEAFKLSEYHYIDIAWIFQISHYMRKQAYVLTVSQTLFLKTYTVNTYPNW